MVAQFFHFALVTVRFSVIWVFFEHVAFVTLRAKEVNVLNNLIWIARNRFDYSLDRSILSWLRLELFDTGLCIHLELTLKTSDLSSEIFDSLLLDLVLDFVCNDIVRHVCHHHLMKAKLLLLRIIDVIFFKFERFTSKANSLFFGSGE